MLRALGCMVPRRHHFMLDHFVFIAIQFGLVREPSFSLLLDTTLAAPYTTNSATSVVAPVTALTVLAQEAGVVLGWVARSQRALPIAPP